MIIRRQDCDHCIWKAYASGNMLAICRYHSKTLMEIFWNNPQQNCDLYEGYRYEDTPE